MHERRLGSIDGHVREAGLILLDDRDQTVGWMRGRVSLVFARSP